MTRTHNPPTNTNRKASARPSRPVVRRNADQAECPICRTHTWSKGITGWANHVNGHEHKADWHPEIQDEEQRKAIFRAEFPYFFAHALTPNRRSPVAAVPALSEGPALVTERLAPAGPRTALRPAAPEAPAPGAFPAAEPPSSTTMRVTDSGTMLLEQRCPCCKGTGRVTTQVLR